MHTLDNGVAESDMSIDPAQQNPIGSVPSLSVNSSTDAIEAELTDTLDSDVSVKYGLERIIVVNSYVKNRARIVYVNDDTHISGRNGRGKTSLYG